MGTHVDRMEEGRSVFKILTGKLTEKGHLGRSTHRWEDKFRTDLTKVLDRLGSG